MEVKKKIDISSEVNQLNFIYDDARQIQLMNAKCLNLRKKYLDYPLLVHLETQAVCNAHCNFCPYDNMERKGMKMSDALIEKIINELADIPQNISYSLNPYKVSEPFLEPRLFDILGLIIKRLPNAKITFITNGVPLTEKKIQQLLALDTSRFGLMSISLNSLNPVEYESAMGIPLDKTLKRLDMLHDYVARGEFTIPVHVTRVAFDMESDLRFLINFKVRYPHFPVRIIRRNDWIGTINLNNKNNLVPNTACKRWFDLSITATGKVALCCMDSEAQYTYGDANVQNVLEIYRNAQMERLRMMLPSRINTALPCGQCTYLN